MIKMQQAHLVQVFQNVIGNSLKYRKSDVSPVVHVSASRQEDKWLWTIDDNGIGFDPAFAERIFKVFKRLHKQHEYSGTGIGLAICARIVAHYGGRIWAEGMPNQGACFKFTLPG